MPNFSLENPAFCFAFKARLWTAPKNSKISWTSESVKASAQELNVRITKALDNFGIRQQSSERGITGLEIHPVVLLNWKFNSITITMIKH